MCKFKLFLNVFNARASLTVYHYDSEVVNDKLSNKYVGYIQISRDLNNH